MYVSGYNPPCHSSSLFIPRVLLSLLSSSTPPFSFHSSPPPHLLETNLDYTFIASPDSIHRMHFLYNISYLEQDEKILQAEFHLFKMRPAPSKAGEPRPPHTILVSDCSVTLLEPKKYD